ncbi:MAG: hypothetical protein H0X62_08810, partial [Bacteroidetes bacterium]|nr:hypothetical protein [Bacteroidota bacterium]
MSIFKKIRKPGYTSFLIAGLLSNIIVFAEPVSRGTTNILMEKNNHSYYIPYSNNKSYIDNNPAFPSSTNKNASLAESSYNKEDNEEFYKNIKLLKKEEPSSRANENQYEFFAIEKQGEIGKEDINQYETGKDNYFNITLPRDLDLQSYDVYMTYELFGLSQGSQTTKSINGFDAFGGKMIQIDSQWKKVKEILPNSQIKLGKNEIFFNRRADNLYSYHVKNLKFELVEKSNKAIQIVENSFNMKDGNVHVLGTIQDRSIQNLEIDKTIIPIHQAVFEYVFTDVEPNKENIEITYEIFGETKKVVVPISKHDREMKVKLFNEEFVSESKLFELKGDNTIKSFNFYASSIKISDESALNAFGSFTVKGINFKDVKPLNHDLLNITAGQFEAYRIEVAEIVDSSSFSIQLAYDVDKIPSGYTYKDIRTFYFDELDKSWKALPLTEIQSAENKVISKLLNTGNETDYINGIIKAPEHPETSNFIPTAMNDIEFANPSAGVVSV